MPSQNSCWNKLLGTVWHRTRSRAHNSTHVFLQLYSQDKKFLLQWHRTISDGNELVQWQGIRATCTLGTRPVCASRIRSFHYRTNHVLVRINHTCPISVSITKACAQLTTDVSNCDHVTETALFYSCSAVHMSVHRRFRCMKVEQVCSSWIHNVDGILESKLETDSLSFRNPAPVCLFGTS